MTIPGVGRKTGNVVRSVAFGLPGLPVDTHVLRVSERLGLTEGLPATARRDAVKVELALNGFIPAPRAGRVQPADDPARAGDLCCPETPLWRMPVGRFLPFGTVIGVARTFSPLFGQFVVVKVKSENPGATIDAGTGSRHLVPKESLLGSASRPTRPMPAFGPALVFPEQVGRGTGSVVVLQVLPSDMVTKRSVSLDDEVAAAVEEAAKQDGVSFSAWLSSAAEKQLRVRQGLRGVAAWEGETGSLSAEELAAGEALLARLRSGVSGVASRSRRR